MATLQTETITKIQFRRGPTSDRTGVTLSDGEPGWDVTQNKLYVGSSALQYPAIPVETGGYLKYHDTATGGIGIDITSFVASSELQAAITTSVTNTVLVSSIPGLVGTDRYKEITFPNDGGSYVDNTLYYKVTKDASTHMLFGYYRLFSGKTYPTIHSEGSVTGTDETIYLGVDNVLAATDTDPAAVRTSIGIDDSGVYADNIFVEDKFDTAADAQVLLPSNTKVGDKTITDFINTIIVNPPDNVNLPTNARIGGINIETYIANKIQNGLTGLQSAGSIRYITTDLMFSASGGSGGAATTSDQGFKIWQKKTYGIGGDAGSNIPTNATAVVLRAELGVHARSGNDAKLTLKMRHSYTSGPSTSIAIPETDICVVGIVHNGLQDTSHGNVIFEIPYDSADPTIEFFAKEGPGMDWRFAYVYAIGYRT